MSFGDDIGIDVKLDADIALLNDVLEEAVAELAGTRCQSLVHDLRDAALALRAGTLEGGREAFAARFDELDLDELSLIARVFTLWFHLVNKAEEQHRIRVLRERDTPESAPEDSVSQGCHELRKAGFSPDDIRALLNRLFIMPVLTAHPTEARRRTVLDHLAVIASTLDTLDRGHLGAREREHVLDALRGVVEALFGTEESRAAKPSPRDEIAAGLDVFETSLLDVTPVLYRALEDALAVAYPGESFDVPSFLRWGSWIGGDRDGNPFVTADTTRYVLARQRARILERYLQDVDVLMRELSISERWVNETMDGAPAAEGSVAPRRADAATVHAAVPNRLAPLEASLVRDRDELPEIMARARRSTVLEPWREKLWYMRARLIATIERDDTAYASVESYLDDLRLLRSTLRACGMCRLADGHVRDAIRRAEVFGFHLATLDLRQHSAVHERAVDELLAMAGVPGYLQRSETERVQALTNALERADFRPPAAHSGLSAETRELLATLDMAGRARRELGPAACDRYIISFTSSISDVLEVLFLIRAARLSPGELRPVPLLEQLEDLDRAAEIADAMLDLAPVRAALGDELEVMIGYSDAGKQIGFFAAAVALRRAQLALADVAERRGVTLTIFHGRGGTIGRGGGPANRAIRAQPPRALRGRLRVTEQGETVTARYGRVEIASRDLEQMVSAVLMSAIDERSPVAAEELGARDEMLDHAAAAARAAYAELLADPERLTRYALAATPIRQVTKLRIGSRPASRKAGLSFADLRAIPWVFSWNQSRHGLPGWFGLGAALEDIISRHGLQRARDLYRESAFFRAIINNAELGLIRSDIDVASHYAALADPDARQVFDLIAAEHGRTMSRVLDVVQHQHLLGNAPHLSAIVQRRNPYVDVLSHAQITLLSRLAGAEESDSEAERERILAILFITINGIAAGLQTAG
jgi:phosphoenolpyruvate carboxylase